ncbi:exodeoxyribonuclease V subunit alpha [Pseudidiomarina andamanensis]|uniref:RecBCD enzyme subunit RecD n=1 Tax=Pseudidiomarina andamanensis TaxID=1940690 RepID=A0AA92EU91_9GAMM|nr:exodeoxyribonuclease V subunit alpha [Pseudidiomarina andamanensis]MDS0219234.1 exodeoxyribonuclease V subunit alpha [Pseudidiomarina andamanensis]QGT95973.1 exodeoxyribonuclease V subunit alpha [Pseudidiomarina andamanensis]
MLENLQLWYQHGWIRAIDLSFAQQLAKQLEDDQEAVVLLAAFVSYQLGRGHPCLDLAQLYAEPEQTLGLPPEHASVESLQACELPQQLLCNVAGAESLESAVQVLLESPAVNNDNSPLVLQGQRLYLRRYFRYEQQIKTDLAARMKALQPVNLGQLKHVLDELFGTQQTISWQRTACAMAMRSLFTIVTGGPGTGKTYTVVRLLATLQKLRGQPEPLRIRLAAPTGKAAARMSESIGNELLTLTSIDDVKADIPTEAVTLHRLLGTLPNSRSFRHHKDNPLHTDVVIIDEASMVDIEMMAAVVNALPPRARLILLGDKDQLASVEAGAILGQLCEQAEHGHYTPELTEWLNATTNVALPTDKTDASGAEWPYLQHTTMFHESRRFDPNKGIGKLADEVNRQQHVWLEQWLQDSDAMAAAHVEFDNIRMRAVPRPNHQSVQQLVEQGYAPLLKLIETRPESRNAEEIDVWAAKILKQLEQFQILTAVREGEWGMHQFNQRISYWLFGDQAAEHGWFEGRPVMVTHNDYSLDLRNGDIGIVLRREPNEPLRVAFPTTDGTIRWLLPSRLTQVDTAFAMTIHKSQGSEFSHTVMVLPEHDVPILTKELLYTGITRAKQQFTMVCAHPQLVLKAVRRRIQRSGGLANG